jgi:hypothetical protein
MMKLERIELPLDGRGRRSNETRLRIDECATLQREGARFFAAASDREIARRLHQALSRYATGAWRRERTCDVCPVRHRGKVTAALWMILKTRDAIPSDRTIRRTLAIRGPMSGM